MRGPWLQRKDRGFENKYNYNGKEEMPFTGYLYYGFRVYDPWRPGFTGVDPLADVMPNWSPYNYTFNNPVRLIDPDGRMPILPGFFSTEGLYAKLNTIKNFGKAVGQGILSTVGAITQLGDYHVADNAERLGDPAGAQQLRAGADQALGQLAVEGAVGYGATKVMNGVAHSAKGLRNLLNDVDASNFDEAVDKVRSINKQFSDGTSKDTGGLESAVNSASYYSDPREQAASLFNSMAGGHVFSNGNKRSASEFIKQYASDNGLKLNLNSSQLKDLTINLANGTKMETSELSTILFSN